MDIIKILTYVIMFAGLVAVIWGIKNMNKTANGRIVMIVGAVVLFGGVAVNVIYSWPTKDKALEHIDKLEAVFRSAKAEKAAQYIADRFPGGAVAFLIDEASYNDTGSESRFVLDEMQKRLGEKGLTCDKVLQIKVAAEEDDANAKKPSSADPEAAFAKSMNSVLKEVVDKVDIVVNFAGMPKSAAAFKDINLLKKASSAGKNNMLIMTDSGLDYVNPAMIENGRVSAIIDYTTEEGQNFDMQNGKAPKDPEKAFNIRYFFINESTLSDFNARENDNYFVNSPSK